jgi:hypothetical protein
MLQGMGTSGGILGESILSRQPQNNAPELSLEQGGETLCTLGQPRLSQKR